MKTILIKIGGSILSDPELINAFCTEIKILKDLGFRIIIVHGGSKAINKTLARYHIDSKFINGLRVTSAEALQVIEMVLFGHLNPLITKKLNHLGLSAIGLSGATQLFFCKKYSEAHGFVGEIKKLNTELIHHLFAFNLSIPVIAPLGIDHQGQTYNINADIAACHLAHALEVDQLLFLTDQEGIYGKDGKTLAHLSAKELKQLIREKIVTDGMQVKAKTILHALEAGLNKILILNGKTKHALVNSLIHSQKIGTECLL